MKTFLGRRSFLSLAAAGLAVATLSLSPVVLAQGGPATIQTELLLYRNSQHPLIGTTSGCCWDYPGAALTANTTQFYANENLSLVFARWVLAWNPNTLSSPTGVRLIHADLGPKNETEIAGFRVVRKRTPIVSAVDITADLQALTAQKTLAHQTFGNGQWGCKIYGSWIEALWETV